MRYAKIIVLSSAILSLNLLGCSEDDEEDEITTSSYEITVTNITNNQPLTPIAIVMHHDGYAPWSLGSASSAGLEVLAESGSPELFISEANANNNVTATDAGNSAITAGNSVTFNLMISNTESDDLKLSIASMLANTNDAFSGVNSWDISGLGTGDSLSTLAKVFDAGTENNDELNTPGSGGEGFNAARDDIDKVTIHRGVVTADDGLSTSQLDETQRWQNYAAKVSITRIN